MKSGIYTITSPSGKQYVGSAIRPSRRWEQHKKQLRSGKHGNINLMRAALKYGIENLRFEVLLVCSPENLLMYEQRAIDILKPAYNIAPIAGSSLGIKRSAEFKARVSRGGKGRKVSAETRAKIGAKHRGKKLSPEHIRIWRSAIPPIPIEKRREMAKAMQTPEARAKKVQAMLGHSTSAETRAKISAALKGRPHSPERIAAITAGKRAAIVQQNGS
jgi:group I intron endonuclease